MRLIKTALNRYRLETDKVSVEGSLEFVAVYAAEYNIVEEKDFDAAVVDMITKGTNVALFGLHVRKSYGGITKYGFMCSIKKELAA